MDERCFACGRKLGRNPTRVDTRDAQTVLVGRECAKLVKASGVAGYQPPKGGPRLYPLPSIESALADMIALAKDYARDVGDCDHTVGICVCSDRRRIEAAEKALLDTLAR